MKTAIFMWVLLISVNGLAQTEPAIIFESGPNDSQNNFTAWTIVKHDVTELSIRIVKTTNDCNFDGFSAEIYDTTPANYRDKNRKIVFVNRTFYELNCAALGPQPERKFISNPLKLEGKAYDYEIDGEWFTSRFVSVQSEIILPEGYTIEEVE